MRVDEPPSIVGTWRLVSFVTTDADGKTRQYWDERAPGSIIYTADGHVSAQLYDARRPRIGTGLVRAYRFEGPDRVELKVVTSADGPVTASTVLTWERVLD